MDEALAKGDYDQVFDHDMNFHTAILRMMNNQLMLEMFSHISDQQQRIRFLTAHIPNRPMTATMEHQRIINAIEKGDREQAARELENHLRKTVDEVLELCKAPSMFSGFIR